MRSGTSGGKSIYLTSPLSPLTLTMSSFKCARCASLVSPDTSLLLLSDGSPVCAACTYTCNICSLPITDEAIMTEDEAYHASCFVCRSCKKVIETMVVARTKAGIYCMSCHGQRVARSRRYAEKKERAKREKERERERERDKLVGEGKMRRQVSSPTSATFVDSGGTSPAVSPTEVNNLPQDVRRISVSVPPPAPNPKRSSGSGNVPGKFPSELYSSSLSPSPTSPTFNHRRASADPSRLGYGQGHAQTNIRHSKSSDHLPHAHGNGNTNTNPPQTPQSATRRSFNPLDVIMDGMARPYTPRTKALNNSKEREPADERFPRPVTDSSDEHEHDEHENGVYGNGEEGMGEGDDTEDIPDALREYFAPSPPLPKLIQGGKEDSKALGGVGLVERDEWEWGWTV